MDAHSEMLMEQFYALEPALIKLREVAEGALKDTIKQNGLYVAGIESRVKQAKSLAGKLELKGFKYHDISDITDLLGMRVITFYSDEVDKVSALVGKLFDIDWENSVDKRALYENDRFGYMSLHYICRLPKSLYYDETMPQLNEIRFEVQMRTALQHVWATVNHDMGYKTDVEIPSEYLRRCACLAGLLELADREFLSFRQGIEDYRRKVKSLIHDGKYDDISLDIDSFTDYLKLEPFKGLNERIASINHAEIQPVSMMPYLEVLKNLMGLKTLGDVERLKSEYGDDAYNLARYQIGNTELDILSSTVGILNLCTVSILRNGGGEAGIVNLYETLYGPRPRNASIAKRVLEQAKKVNIQG